MRPARPRESWGAEGSTDASTTRAVSALSSSPERSKTLSSGANTPRSSMANGCLPAPCGSASRARAGPQAPSRRARPAAGFAARSAAAADSRTIRQPTVRGSVRSNQMSRRFVGLNRSSAPDCSSRVSTISAPDGTESPPKSPWHFGCSLKLSDGREKPCGPPLLVGEQNAQPSFSSTTDHERAICSLGCSVRCPRADVPGDCDDQG